MVIAHNIAAMNLSRNLSIASGKNQKSTEKLSSGYRINRSADDAAGLTISEKMRSLVRGLTQASKNAQDGISLIQTADGALEEVQSSIHRMKELCVKAANGTNTQQDRDAIQMEIDELAEEIDRIAYSTEFNQKKLLDGSLSEASPYGREAAPVSGATVIYDAYTTSQVPMGGDTTAGHARLAQDLEKQIVPQIVNSLLDKYPAFSYLGSSNVGIGLRLYSQNSNTLAYVSSGYQEESGGATKGYKEYQLGVNLKHLSFNADGSLTTASREELEATIAHEMVHAFMAEATTNGMLGGDRFPLWFVEGMAQTASGPNGWTSSLSSTSSNAEISNFLSKIGSSYGAGDGVANYGTGYLADMYLGYMAGTGGSLEARISDGLNKIMGTVIGGSSLDAAIAQHTKYGGLAEFSHTLKDDTDAYDFVRDLLNQTGSGRGGLVTGDLTASDLASDANASSTLFKLYPNKEKVQNIYSGDYTILSGGGATSPEPPPGTSSSALWSVGSGDVSIQAGATANDTIDLRIENATASALGVGNLSVTTQESARWALETCDYALARVSDNRSSLGAYQNRLEHAIMSLDATAENTQASESLIRDTDIADEILSHSCSNIIMQAAQTFLAQANQSPQSVLSLIS